VARAGSKAHRVKRGLDEDERKELEIARRYMKARDELVSELWRFDRMLGVRNMIIQRLQDHLTPEEKEALAHG